MALNSSHISLTERGNPSVVTERDWQMHGLDEASKVLRTLGVISETPARGFHIIEPRQFVGQYRSHACSIRIEPRRPELFDDLRRFVVGFPEKRRAAESSTTPDEAENALDPAILFCPALETAAQAGLPFLYCRRTIATSHPRGRVDFTDTFRRFHSRGIRHKIISHNSIREYDGQLTGVLALVVSLLRRDYSIPGGLLARLEILACLLEGVPVYTIAEAEDLAKRLIRSYEAWKEVRRVLTLSQAILSNQQQIWDMQVPIAGGECRFCNMDRLWELAVLTAFQRTWTGVGRTVEYHPYRNRNHTLLVGGGPEIDPDVVAFEAGRPAIIIDAKYSEAQAAAASDVYQLVCYVQRLQAALGILVYLSSSSTWHVVIGTAEGNRVIAAGAAGAHRPSYGLLQVASSVCADYEAPTISKRPPLAQ